MKKTFTVLFLIFTLASFSQREEMIGDYFLKLGGENHLIEYKLTLSQEGVFEFHSYSDHKDGIPQIVHLYGKGKWSLDGKVLSFFIDKGEDLNEKYTLDFSNSKARFITKPPRDKTNRIIKTRLKFFESEISWIKGLDMDKM